MDQQFIFYHDTNLKETESMNSSLDTNTLCVITEEMRMNIYTDWGKTIEVDKNS